MSRFCQIKILSLVIIPFILLTCVFDQVVILLGEIRCLSLLGLKGLLLTDVQEETLQLVSLLQIV